MISAVGESGRFGDSGILYISKAPDYALRSLCDVDVFEWQQVKGVLHTRTCCALPERWIEEKADFSELITGIIVNDP